MKKRKEYTKQLMNNLKEKDQMMEDSMFQKHITMEEQLRVKKYEKEKQDKKDRKKKELEEQFEKQNSEITQALVTILKKSYKEVEVRYAEGEEYKGETALNFKLYNSKHVDAKEFKRICNEVVYIETQNYNKLRDIA